MNKERLYTKDELLEHLTAVVSTVWPAKSYDDAQSIYDEFLIERGLKDAPLTRYTNKVTIILGSPGSGKTRKARELVKGREAATIDFGGSGERALSALVIQALKMTPEAKVIVIEGVNDVSEIRILASLRVIRFRKPYSPRLETVRVPDLIITSQLLTLSEFPRLKQPNIEYIELSRSQERKAGDLLSEINARHTWIDYLKLKSPDYPEIYTEFSKGTIWATSLVTCERDGVVFRRHHVESAFSTGDGWNKRLLLGRLREWAEMAKHLAHPTPFDEIINLPKGAKQE